MKYNYNSLLGRMREKGLTQAAAAAMIGICPERLNARLNNKAVFKQSEIVKLCAVLDIPSGEIGAYFFSH